jgi:uncharacterized protein (TIGR02001 family)
MVSLARRTVDQTGVGALRATALIGKNGALPIRCRRRARFSLPIPMMTIRTRSMRRLSLLATVLGIVPGPSLAQSTAGRFSLAATAASDYFDRGLRQTGAGPALRIAADFTHGSGFFAGGFIANVEYQIESAFSRPRDTQLNVYAGYERRGRNWTAAVMLSRYRYPDLVISYDYTQIAATAGFRDRFFVGAAYADDWLGIGGSSYRYDVGATLPLERNFELGATLGRMHTGALFLGGSFTYWDVGVSKVIDRFALDLRYHQATLDRPTLLGSPDGERWALSVTYAILPR